MSDAVAGTRPHMTGLADLKEGDRRLTRRMAHWTSPLARQVLPAVESAAERTKLWWAAAAIMSAAGGYRERKAAVAGLATMGVAELVSNAVCKQLYERRRPPKELIPHEDVHDRPDSSSFPSGHTAAAVGFTVAVAGTCPGWGAACAVPAVAVAVERVHSGAHYPSDVAVGTVIGLASAWLVRRAPGLWLRRLL
ncbi:phosphatase PAP2 family protein [Streptomyces sp. ISL-99]|uniref:phosphatase PAP2 family protein n=1 Tax=Streptomyces sp. ISL-99 TaxID=2819193 RepID=UPI002034C27A|nr:phosphatase PAP2 family protein [Streptomyces sp. ISL-99]